jgi:hypothetical protein
MLVSFSVTNFRSFGEEATLNMVASNKLNDHPNHLVPIGETGKSVVRTAIIYGANAAGKSNLIQAMSVAQRLILAAPERVPAIIPFSFQQADSNRPTTFEFRILIEGHVFVYGFDVKQGRKYSSEWLTVVRGDGEEVVFERTDDNVRVPESGSRTYLSDPQSFAMLTAFANLPLKSDQLFISRAFSIPDSSQGKTLNAIVQWFANTLVILGADSREMDILDLLHHDSKFRSFCSRFLSSVGTGVGGLAISETRREMTEWEKRYPRRRIRPDTDIVHIPEEPGSVIVRKLFSEHLISPEKYTLPFAEESDGTQALIHLLPVLAGPEDESRVIIVDELDRSLHPLICWEFVRFFSESCEGARRQLIVTTHEAHLLNQELLRRDEYWFVEKDERTQETRLVPLTDFRIRNDLKLERGYMMGRFGAIPIICGMRELEALLECTESENANAAETTPS